MKTALAALTGLAAALALAGCTGSFNIDQTEPIRIRLEGDGETVVVNEGESREAVLETGGAQKVVVHVDATSKSSAPAVVIVQVKDQSTGQVLGERRVNVGNGTVTESITVDVRGNNNLVVVTQAEDGDATVDITANSVVQGGGTVTVTDTATDTTTGTATGTLTGTVSGTLTGTTTPSGY